MDKVDGASPSVQEHLNALEQRVATLATYRDTDAQTTLRIERQIELLQLQIDKLSDLIERMAKLVKLED
jgi:hypothetical protein